MAEEIERSTLSEMDAPRSSTPDQGNALVAAPIGHGSSGSVAVAPVAPAAAPSASLPAAPALGPQPAALVNPAATGASAPMTQAPPSQPQPSPSATSAAPSASFASASVAPAVAGSLSSPPASTPSGTPTPPALDAPALYVNRELSWLEFNARVLAEADDPSVPLYERIKFLSIVTANLDEFFMVRVAGLKQQLSGEVEEPPPDGMMPQEQLAALSARAHKLVDAQYHCWTDQLVPALAREGVMLVKPADLAPDELASLDVMFKNDIFPVLTPIAIDPGHPFPHLRNKSLNLGVMFARENELLEPGFGVVQVPSMLSRVMPVKRTGARSAFVLLEDVIARHVHQIFPVLRLRGTYAFRVTRNWDLEIDEEEAEDLLQTIQQELRRRDRGNAVRLEISGEVLPGSLARLCQALKLDPQEDVYHVTGPLNFADLARYVARDERRELRDEPFSPQIVPPLRESEDLFTTIREKDILLHHPYESFDSVMEFISRAADDPGVLAIKQTLYRTTGDSPIIKALGRAAENGKQVTAIVELKARFDEESNIQWARTLEQAGVHVVYGLLGLKTHAKAALVVRREKDKLRRYVHLSTGNYHPATARLYTDLSLFTAREQIGEDVTALFNLLTGYSAPAKWNLLVVAPLGLHEAVLGLIRREAEHARAGRPAGIIAKLNALVDPDVIEALYQAAQSGVPITLLVRGVCGLRPNVAGVSERIQVRAHIDRFLEHSRIACFKNGGQDEVFISSADWMPRNFHRRVEVMVPIVDPDIKNRLMNEILAISRADNVKSWTLRSDGSYTRVTPAAGETPRRAQSRFIELARERVKEGEAHIRASGRYQFVQVHPAAKSGAPEERRRRQTEKRNSSTKRRP
ncbi:MAG TPA: polyphosphate kinase 1 [Polyangiaceae bacterium]|nr:polyphosphate kinase 1 [Polyangiaceae bacterium]